MCRGPSSTLLDLGRRRADVDDDRAGDVVVPAAALAAAGPSRRSRRGWPGRGRTSGSAEAPSDQGAQQRGATPIGVPDPRWTTRSPSSALPGEMPVSPSRTAKTRPRARPPRRRSTRDAGPTRSSEKKSRYAANAGQADQRPGDQPVDGERVEAPVEARRRGTSAPRWSRLGSHRAGLRTAQGFMTWMVTPSPRSRIAPGISWTAMPGWRSSGGEAGLDQHGAVGRAEVGDDGGAVVGAGARPHLEVGGGDLLVRAGHGDQRGAARSRGSAAPRARGRSARARSTSTVWPLEKTRRATGRVMLGAGWLPGDAGLLRSELCGSWPARVMPSWSVPRRPSATGARRSAAGRRRARRTASARRAARAAGRRAARSARARVGLAAPGRPRARAPGPASSGRVSGSGSASGTTAAGSSAAGRRTADAVGVPTPRPTPGPGRR